MWMISANAILDRLKSLKKIKADTELAEILGVRRTAVANWRHRESIPFRLLLAYCEKERINPGWLFAGIGTAEGETSYRSSTKAKIDAIVPDHPLVDEIIDELIGLEEEDLRRVLDLIRERKSFREMQNVVRQMQKGYKVR